MASVHQHRELHAGGAAVVEDLIDRGADRAPRVKHVVDDHDRASIHRKVELGGVDDRRARADREVVPVERDVYESQRNG